jgi:hypothetical protein
MPARLLALSVALLALAVGATHVVGRLGHQPDTVRMAILYALPGAIFLCGRVAFPRRPIAPSLRDAGRRSPWIAAAIALDLAPIGLAYLAGALTLTYGDQTLAATRVTTALWALPLLVLVAFRFSERPLRATLYAAARTGAGPRAAWILTLLCGTALALPAVAPGFDFSERPFVVAALAVALCREVTATALFQGSGLVAAGIYRGVLAYVDGYVIHDWVSPLFPGANYVSSSDLFYLGRVAGPLAAALLLLVVLVRRKAPG